MTLLRFVSPHTCALCQRPRSEHAGARGCPVVLSPRTVRRNLRAAFRRSLMRASVGRPFGVDLDLEVTAR